VVASVEEINEDWVKHGFFDFWKPDGSGQVEAFGDMWPWTYIPPTPEQLEAIRHFTELPAWHAAPEKLKEETAEFLREHGGMAGAVSTTDLTKMLGHDDASIRKAAAAELGRRLGFD
jgi:hypothetical protein